MTYHVFLRARKNRTWQVLFFADKQRLFRIPYRKEGAAMFMAAKLVDELLLNRQDFTFAVQDEYGQSIDIDLVKVAQQRRVRKTS